LFDIGESKYRRRRNSEARKIRI